MKNNKSNIKDINNSDIMRGLESSYDKMLEFKKYKKTPVIVEIDGIIKEIDPEVLIAERKKAKEKKEQNQCS